MSEWSRKRCGEDDSSLMASHHELMVAFEQFLKTLSTQSANPAILPSQDHPEDHPRPAVLPGIFACPTWLPVTHTCLAHSAVSQLIPPGQSGPCWLFPPLVYRTSCLFSCSPTLWGPCLGVFLLAGGLWLFYYPSTFHAPHETNFGNRNMALQVSMRRQLLLTAI